MRYALAAVWFERRRFLPGVLAVAFSAVLVAVQLAVFWGIIGLVSVPVLRSTADVWVGYPNAKAVDVARPVPRYWLDRVWATPGVTQADELVQGMAVFTTPDESNELTIVLGGTVGPHALGPTAALPPAVRDALAEPDAVALDAVDCHKLGITAAGQFGRINGKRVRVVGFAAGLTGVQGPFTVCSADTARRLLGLRDDQTTFLLARCPPDRAGDVVGRLRADGRASAFRADEFALNSKVHFLTKTRAGVAVTFVAVLGLVVGAVITGQTLYAGVAASARELAVLRALGVPPGRLRRYVLDVAALVGGGGLLLGVPAAAGLVRLAQAVGTQAELPPWILITTASLTFAMALLAGLFALRSLRRADPNALLR